MLLLFNQLISFVNRYIDIFFFAVTRPQFNVAQRPHQRAFLARESVSRTSN